MTARAAINALVNAQPVRLHFVIIGGGIGGLTLANVQAKIHVFGAIL
jgi:hypothetical protein